MLRVRNFMQCDVITVGPELTLRELLEVLADYGVSGAPDDKVTDDGELGSKFGVGPTIFYLASFLTGSPTPWVRGSR